MNATMLHIADLRYRYQASKSAQLFVKDFTLGRGEHAIVLGPSGCGKSTLLHLLAGILTPQDGRLEVAGTALNALPSVSADRWRGETIGFLPQKLALVPSLSARENLLLSAYANGCPADLPRAAALLASLGLQDQADAKPHQLSQGQRQRVALARAVFNRPKVLLADEPTANLDDDSCKSAIELLVGHASEVGASLVIATHDARVVSALTNAKILRLTGNQGADRE